MSACSGDREAEDGGDGRLGGSHVVPCSTFRRGGGADLAQPGLNQNATRVLKCFSLSSCRAMLLSLVHVADPLKCIVTKCM